eukprot:CAMPEP_0178944674 /NCGR_PEP_ID=MMETSP0789-20121207/3291_1 /TAXON_ID=3005 /ORGANISM="Rhizosolenia setigera, Strain CCMP 1694" /LENGTH=438 /DNA_ID=CAMNT_0020624441 /DNA_START=1322 /DNA_END=2638 /DNA_ORIENTATION=-
MTAFSAYKPSLLSPSMAATTSTINNKKPFIIQHKNENQINDIALHFLRQQLYTEGLIHTLAETKSKFPLRLWIADNSESMYKTGGSRFIQGIKCKSTKKTYYNTKSKINTLPSTTGSGVSVSSSCPLRRAYLSIQSQQEQRGYAQSCSRWSEVKDCLAYHIQVSSLLQTPSRFQLLNDPGRSKGLKQHFSIAENTAVFIKDEIEDSLNLIDQIQPCGYSPLIHAVREAYDVVYPMKDRLQTSNQKVSIVFLTDGLPSDEFGVSTKDAMLEFSCALRQLEQLPVYIVIRLCSSDKKVIDFYKRLDRTLMRPLDVVQDFFSETKIVQTYQKWLTYPRSMHQCREMGCFDSRVMDTLNERRLTLEETREFFVVLFGDETLPQDPEKDFDLYVEAVEKLNEKESLQWNIVSKKYSPLIDMKKFKKEYSVEKKKSFFSRLLKK